MSCTQLVVDASSPETQNVDEEVVRNILVGTFGEEEQVKSIIDAIVMRLEESNPTVMLKTLVLLHRVLRDGGQPLLTLAMSSDDGPLLRSPLLGVLSNQDAVPAHWTDHALLLKYRTYLTMRLKSTIQLRHEDAAREDGTVDASVGHFRKLPMLDLFDQMPKLQDQLATLLDAQRESTRSGSEGAIGLDRDVVARGFSLMMKDTFSLHRCASEGVVNLLEHFFTLDRVSAMNGMDLYKRFMAQTDSVIGMHSTAKQLPPTITGPYPDVQPAPPSLLSALEEYINQISGDDQQIAVTQANEDESYGFGGLSNTAGPGRGSFALNSKQLDQVLVKIEKLERAVSEGTQAHLLAKASVREQDLTREVKRLQDLVAERQKAVDALKGGGGFFGFGGKKKDPSEEERVKAAEATLNDAQQQLSAALANQKEASAAPLAKLTENSEERIAAELKELKELVVQVASNANDVVAKLQMKLETLEAGRGGQPGGQLLSENSVHDASLSIGDESLIE